MQADETPMHIKEKTSFFLNELTLKGIFFFVNQKKKGGADMVAQQVKSHDTKPEKLSLIPGTHT